MRQPGMRMVMVVGLTAAVLVPAAAAESMPQAASGTAALPLVAATEVAEIRNAVGETRLRLAEMQTSMLEFQREFRTAVGDVRRDMRTLMADIPTDALNSRQVAGVTVGALAGGLMIDLLGGSGIATLVGAAAGALTAHWLMLPPDDAASAVR